MLVPLIMIITMVMITMMIMMQSMIIMLCDISNSNDRSISRSIHDSDYSQGIVSSKRMNSSNRPSQPLRLYLHTTVMSRSNNSSEVASLENIPYTTIFLPQ